MFYLYFFVFSTEILNRNFHKNEIVLIGHTLKIILIWLKGISSLLKEKRDDLRRTKRLKYHKTSFRLIITKTLTSHIQGSSALLPRVYVEMPESRQYDFGIGIVKIRQIYGIHIQVYCIALPGTAHYYDEYFVHLTGILNVACIFNGFNIY